MDGKHANQLISTNIYNAQRNKNKKAVFIQLDSAIFSAKLIYDSMIPFHLCMVKTKRMVLFIAIVRYGGGFLCGWGRPGVVVGLEPLRG